MTLEAFLREEAALPSRPLARLVRGAPDPAAARWRLATAGALLAPRPVRDEAAGRAVLAGVLTALDAFEEAHALAQEVPSRLGSWWHAILHRREPDASNAGYWYRRVRPSPESAARAAADARAALGGDPPPALARLAATLDRAGGWDPLAIVAACEAARRDGDAAAVAALALVQQAEWRVVLDDSIAAARGA